MSKTVNPFQFYGLNGEATFESLARPLSEEEIQEIVNSNVELKDKFLEKVEYVGKNLVFTVKAEEGEEKIEVPIADFLDDTFATDDDMTTEADRAKKAEGELQEAIEAEATRAKEAESGLSEAINNAVSDADAKYETIEGAAEKYQPIGEYYTKGEVDSKIGDATDDMATQEWVKGENFATKEEVSAVEEKIPSLEGYATEEWVESQKYLTDHQDLSDYAKSADVEKDIKAAIDDLVNGADGTMDTLKELADAIGENKGVIETLNEAITSKQDKGDYVEYSDYQGRKTIQLKNYDSISAIKTTGEGVNLAMVSKWDVADFGSTQLPINLNGSEAHPTYNDNKEIAFVDEIPSIDHLATTDALNTVKEELEGKIDIKADTTDVNASIEAAKTELNAEIDKKADASVLDNYQTKAEAASEHAAIEDKIPVVTEFFDGASYNDSTKNIEFTNGGVVKATVSAAPFIKDGMIEKVEVKDGKLVITFNTDAGKEAIELPITDIFNASNYYTKEEVDGELANKQDAGNYVAWGSYQGRKIIELDNRDAISGKLSNGGGANLIMVSGYEGLDFDVVEVGSPQAALVLNTLEGVVKIEGPDKTQKVIATTDQIPNIDGLATEEDVASLEATKADKTEIPSLDGYAKTAEVESALAEKQDVGDYVAYTTFAEGRKTISLGNRDTISAVTPKGGSQIAMVSDYDGVDVPVVEIGGLKAALVLNSGEERVKVEVTEEGKRVQHEVATLDDLKDYPKYEAYVNGDINKKTITLENDDNISGKRKDGLSVNLVEVSRWDVADFGSKSVHINLNGAYERPSYNDKKGIALLDDVENLKNEMKDYFTALLKNYTLKSDSEIINTISNGGKIVLVNDALKPSGDFNLLKDSEIDLNGNTIGAKIGGTYGDSIVIGNGANVTIKNGIIKESEEATQEKLSAVILIKTSSATQVTLDNVEVEGLRPLYLNNSNTETTVTIKSGTFTCTGESGEAVYVQKGGKITIEGGYFSNPNATTYKGFLLNIKDDIRQGKDPREFIEVKGGTFVNFDPSNNKAEGEGTNFVADGYHVESKLDGDDILYTVVKD